MGVPQGSILSVTLFIVKINSITRCIRNGVDKFLFVDDFGVSYQSKHMQAIGTCNFIGIELKIGLIIMVLNFPNQRLSVSIFIGERGLHPDPYLVLYNNPIPFQKGNKIPWHFTRFKTDICPSYQGP